MLSNGMKIVSHCFYMSYWIVFLEETKSRHGLMVTWEKLFLWIYRLKIGSQQQQEKKNEQTNIRNQWEINTTETDKLITLHNITEDVLSCVWKCLLDCYFLIHLCNRAITNSNVIITTVEWAFGRSAVEQKMNFYFHHRNRKNHIIGLCANIYTRIWIRYTDWMWPHIKYYYILHFFPNWWLMTVEYSQLTATTYLVAIWNTTVYGSDSR